MLEEMNLTTAIAVIITGVITWFLKGRGISPPSPPSPAPGPTPLPNSEHRPIADAVLVALGMSPQQREALKAILDALNMPAPLGALPKEQHR